MLAGMNDTPTDLVTLAVLARRLRVSAAWLRSEVEAGRLPHLRAGRRTLFNVEAVKQTLLNRAAGEGVDRDA